ncbi:hypothetical protein BJI69_11060 [Luteibacter rhizovicinus DSM 16549]|uniref:Uncharacterized protein n=1 Tax=Luteibacter rhizovicinus DSM 16549 TaxID=1440763 RepID=A0A0G9HI75_9GAMM|nr:hypothetical protein [Luteibacter rhizovicinus]APG04382.1 hypothetical protein BJI69_11060 [Luteibacter rhizovicinus DSM 16549]KLD67367.1 hypothetical protein Y883_08265 [Luteibacter rhizovicinus DSM 16549]KLD75309.1 hypothetical protein Y886_27765 [Xanthomonas hyacinthi DSM 19077]
MYYKVRINGLDFGTFGHPNVLNMNVSVLWANPDGADLFANAVCMEDGKKYLYDWVQHRLVPTDVVEIRPTDDRNVPEPRKKYEMKGTSGDD